MCVVSEAGILCDSESWANSGKCFCFNGLLVYSRFDLLTRLI